MDRPGVRQVPEGRGELGKMEETGCEIICGAPNDPRGWEIDEVKWDNVETSPKTVNIGRIIPEEDWLRRDILKKNCQYWPSH